MLLRRPRGREVLRVMEKTAIALGWIALVLMILFITTDVDAHIAYIAYENDWRLIAWLFSRSYPSL